MPASCYKKENLPTIAPEFDVVARPDASAPSNATPSPSIGTEVRSQQDAEAERLRLERLYSVARAR